jgi:hypothetical protein
VQQAVPVAASAAQAAAPVMPPGKSRIRAQHARAYAGSKRRSRETSCERARARARERESKRARARSSEPDRKEYAPEEL